MIWPRCIARCGRRAERDDLLCKECRIIADNAPYDQDAAWLADLWDLQPDQ